MRRAEGCAARIALAVAIWAGHCVKLTEYARDCARQRVQLGRRITDRLDAGLPALTEASLAKVVASENNVKCADVGMQIMGGVGPIGGGTNEIQRNTLAKQMDLA